MFFCRDIANTYGIDNDNVLGRLQLQRYQKAASGISVISRIQGTEKRTLLTERKSVSVCKVCLFT